MTDAQIAYALITKYDGGRFERELTRDQILDVFNQIVNVTVGIEDAVARRALDFASEHFPELGDEPHAAALGRLAYAAAA